MQEISLVAAIMTVLNEISSWPVVLILVVFFVVPPLILAHALKSIALAMVELREDVRQSEERQKQRYENNVLLVKNYEQISRDLLGVIQLNSDTAARLGELIKQALRNN